ncbi:MAG: dihydroorotase [Dissulfurimicrobium sp.]|uniref:dihydroorotase n=2 Tax=Deltaproteobacteria incertae sedis TaxID=45456 RepID=UPI001EDAEC3E|nr:dihydroorotase [Dissulfurimicrobium hydrothermale]UKL14503.1 dihydroorotase [Dissulfurimicrobium hydrothermale]
MRPIFLQNLRILDPETRLDVTGDILIMDGRIAAIGDEISPPDDVRMVDCSGMWAAPGLMDMHVHLREPGEEYKETIETGTLAAVAGGFTAVASMPNTNPVNDTSAVTRFVIERAISAGYASVYPVASITKGLKGKELSEFADLMGAGAVAFSDDGYPVSDPGMMRLALEYAKGLGALIISHAEELALSSGGVLNEGRISTILGLKGIPSAAEDIAVFRDVCLAEFTGARLHIAHVSTIGAVQIIRQAKAMGVKVTAETAPHYFSLTEEAVLGYDVNAKVNPPLRTEEDRLAVIDGLRDGTIDVIATDHAPHSILEKEKEFETAANGMIGLETALPLALELVRAGVLTPLELIRRMSLNPRKILGIQGGRIKPGGAADLCVIDPEAMFVVNRENLRSRSLNTPFLGKTLKGRAVLTVSCGKIVHNLLW